MSSSLERNWISIYQPLTLLYKTYKLFRHKHIPESDGFNPVVTWIEKVELICHLNGGKESRAHHVIMTSTFNMYQQMKEEERKKENPAALFKAFAMPPSETYEQFCSTPYLMDSPSSINTRQ